MPPARDLSNPNYCNWVKVGTALKYFTEGLRNFINEDMKAQHALTLECTKTKLTSLGKDPDVCNECTVYNILPCSPLNACENRRNNCRVHHSTDQRNKPLKCKKDFCQIFYEQIKDSHERRKPSWHNTTAQRWSFDHIELAKCFLSECEANSKVKTIKDIDTIGLLDILENNIPIGNSLSSLVKNHQKSLYKVRVFFFFTSPEHKVLMVSFCDRPMSSVCRPSCIIHNFFKHLLLLNHWPNLDETWQGCSLGEALPKLYKRSNSTHNSGCHGNKKEKIAKSLKIFFCETRRHRALIFGMLHPLVDLYQDCSYDAPGVKTGPSTGVTSLKHTNKEGKLQNSSSLKLESAEL